MSDQKKNKKRKTFTKPPDFEEIDVMVETKGLSKKTTQKREFVEGQFNTNAETFGMRSLDDLCKDETPKEDIDRAMCAFFNSFTVGNNEELPKKNYADSFKSHLRVLIKQKTKNRIDICDPIRMPNFHVSFLFCFLIIKMTCNFDCL